MRLAWHLCDALIYNEIMNVPVNPEDMPLFGQRRVLVSFGSCIDAIYWVVYFESSLHNRVSSLGPVRGKGN